MLILFRLESEGRARKERMNGHGTFQYVSFNFVRDLTRQELPLGVRPLPNQIRPSRFQIDPYSFEYDASFLEISSDFEEKKDRRKDVITRSIDSHRRAG